MKLKNEFVVICLILFLLIGVSAVSAAENNTDIIQVTDDTDILSIDDADNVEILSDTNDGSFADLNNTINGDSSTNIVLDKNYTYSPSDTIEDGIVISKDNTVIDGQGYTIDAKGKSRIFDVEAYSVTLKNIRFINANANYGAAIWATGDNFKVINCTFINNIAENWGGAIYSYPETYAAFINSTFINNKAGDGGAIAIREGNMQEVIKCNFYSNQADSDGGALFIYGFLGSTENPGNDYVNIKGSTFIDNKAEYGSAIDNFRSAWINVTDSIILGNPEDVIYAFGTMFYVDNNWWGNTVDNKSVKPNVTANVKLNKWLYFDLIPHIDTSSASVSINNLYDNKTGENSVYSSSVLPAVKFYFDSVNATLAVNNGETDNTGNYDLKFTLLGNAVLTAYYNDTIKVSKKLKIGGLKELEILINSARNNGVIRLDKDYVFTPGIDSAESNIFIDEKDDIIIDGRGHTINAMGKSRLFYVNSHSSMITFKNMNIVNGWTNDGDDGAGAYVIADNTTFINCTFINNTAVGYGSGGALNVFGAKDCSVINCTFIDNTHTESGGGAISWREYATIINTTFINNTAPFDYAGAIVLHNGGLIDACTFINNSAVYAGAIFSLYHHADIVRSVFIDNYVTSSNIEEAGGALYIGDVSVNDCTFIGNTAISGAAILMVTKDAAVEKSIFINNTVTGTNGIIYSLRGGKVVNSVFLNNNVDAAKDWNYFVSFKMGSNQIEIINKIVYINDEPYDINETPVVINNMTLYRNGTDLFVNNYKLDMRGVQVGVSGFIISCNEEKALKADYNWYGYTGDDYTKTPNVSNLADMTKWLFLNATEPNYNNETKEFDAQFTFFAYDDISKTFVHYDADELSPINLKLSAQNVTLNENNVLAGDDFKGIVKYYKGIITAQYENVKCVAPFIFKIKVSIAVNSTVNITKFDNISLGDYIAPFDPSYTIFLHEHSRITYTSNDTNIVEVSADGKVSGVNLGVAEITIYYNGLDPIGDDIYTPATAKVLVYVNKFAPKLINATEVPKNITVGQETDHIIFNLHDLRDQYVPNVQYEFINNNPEVLSISSNKDWLFFRGIKEGLANVTVVAKESEFYYTTNMTVTFNVVRQNTSFNITSDNIYIKAKENYNLGTVLVISENNALSITSNDTGVAVVEKQNGKYIIKGIGNGIANLTVKFEGNNEYYPLESNIIVNVGVIESHIDVADEISIFNTDSEILTPKLLDSYNKTVDAQFIFTSNDTNVVKVDDDGKITAVGIGKAKITINYPGSPEYSKSAAEVIVNVENDENNIHVGSNVEIHVDERININATLDHGSDLIYLSNNTSIVEVDERGYITGKKTGTATITVTYKGDDKYLPSSQNVTVKVTKIPTQINVDKAYAWEIGENSTINATLTPAEAGYIHYMSNDENIIKVDNQGKITAVGVGQTTIIITLEGDEKYESASETVDVTVFSDNMPTSVEVNRTIDLKVDDTADIGAVLNPANAGKLVYQSSDSSIVKVDEKGQLKALKTGTATITVKFNGNKKYGSSNATVTVRVSLIETNIEADKSVSVNVTENTIVNYVFSHPEAGDLELEIDNPSIAYLQKGKIIGAKVGNTTLFIKFKGNAKYAPSNATVEIIVSDVESIIDVSENIKVNLTKSSPINAQLITGKGKLHYKDDGSGIISIDAGGNIKGLKLGTANVTISCDANGKYRAATKTVTVEVVDVETRIDSEDEITVNVTENTRIDAHLVEIFDAKLTYSTNDTNIIQIDKYGNIKALKVGNATVTIAFEGKDQYRAAVKNVTVHVCEVETEIEVNDSVTLTYGDKINLNATLKPVEEGSLTYTSSNPEIVSVDEKGNLITLKSGTANITVTFEGAGKYAACNKTVEITVKRAPTAVIIDSELTMEIGSTVILTPRTSPAGLYDFAFVSGDKSIVDVNDNGQISTLKGGNTLITVKYLGDECYLPSEATVNVTVKNRDTYIEVDENVTIGFSEQMNLNAVLKTKSFTMTRELVYVSSNPEIVSVDKDGKITAKRIGKAVITINYLGEVSYNPSNATVNVEVTTKTTHIIMDESATRMYVDDTFNIDAKLDVPIDYRLSYESSDMDVVFVNPMTGELKAISEGQATITVRYAGTGEYHASSAEFHVTVSKIKTHIKGTTTYAVTALDDKTLDATVTAEDGKLTYNSDNPLIVSVDSNGKMTANKAGTVIITIKYAGNNKYLPCEKEVIVDVSKIATKINVTDLTLNSGEDFKLENIVAPSGVPTKAKFYEFLSYDTGLFDVDSDGVITTFHEGSEELFIAFTGNDVYEASNKTVRVTVVKKLLTSDEFNLTVDVEDDIGKVTFTAKLPEDVKDRSTFRVTIGKDTYSSNFENGVAVVEIEDLNPGEYKAAIRFSGDEKYLSYENTTTFHIGKYKIDKNKDISVLYTSKKTVKYTMHLTKDTQAMEGKTITFTFNGKKYYAVTDKLGYASITVKLPATPKTYKITAQFNSIKVTNNVKITHLVVAKNVNAKKSAKNVKIKVSLKKVNKKYLSGKKLTLKFNGKKFTAKTNKKGVATFTIKKSVYSKLKVGKNYKYTVTYLKDTVKKSIKFKK